MRRFATILLVVVSLGLSAASTPVSASATSFTDARNDPTGTYDARGDIVSTWADYTDSTITLGIEVAQPEDPVTALNWIEGMTAAVWGIDVTGDADDEYWVWLINGVGGVVAAVQRASDGSIACVGAWAYQQKMYLAQFNASCIGSPSLLWISGYMGYDTGWADDEPSSEDYVPDFPGRLTLSRTTSPPPGPGSGYWMIDSVGTVYAFGGAVHYGNQLTQAADLEPTPSMGGYWILNRTGQVFLRGNAENYGEATMLSGEEATSMSATPTGKGYWIFTDRGRVLPFGDAVFHGDMSGTRLNGPVLDSVATPSGKGYYMVASDGGIFSFGDATFFGSTGAMTLNKPVMSMAPDPDGAGYWLVASDGGIFAFSAGFFGSMGATPLNKPVSGMVPGPGGYLMVAEDGGIFAFGTVPFHGSLGANPPSHSVVAVAYKPAT